MSRDLKTNAVRKLDVASINYEIKSLNIKEAVDGVTCANMLKVDVNSTFKTLVTTGKSGKHYVFVIPVAEKLSLKKVANIVGEKNIEMLPAKDLFSLTGYVHGGCSPIGMKKEFKTIIDESALLFDKIIFSAGKIGHFIQMNPSDLNRIIPVEFFNIVQ